MLKDWKSLILKKKDSILCGLFCLLAATGFVLIASTSTSPLYAGYYAYGENAGGDSLQFQTIGKAWLDGSVPYRDTFDHKGPMIFLMDALGFALGGGARYGIVILQILSLAVVLWYAFKFAQLVTPRRIWGGALAVALLIALSYVYVEGNSVQEYCLPWLMASMYYIVRFLTGKSQQHAPKYALLYGVTLGWCLFSQVTNAVPIAAGILVVAIVLIWRKEWQNLGQNLLMGLGGMALVAVPLMIYFALQGALGEMFYAMLVFNFQYAGGVGSWLGTATGAKVIWMLTCYLPCLLLPLTALFAWRRDQKAYAGALLLTWLTEMYIFLFTQAFVQYAQPMAIQIVLFLNEIWLLAAADRTARGAALRRELTSTALVLLAGGVLLLNFTYDQIVGFLNTRADTFWAIRRAGGGELPIGYEGLMEKYVVGEAALSCESFTAYADNQAKSIYLRYDLPVYNKYFIIQDWHAGFADTVAAAIETEFAERSPSCLLVQGEGERTTIAPLIAEHYKLVDAENGFELYRHR